MFLGEADAANPLQGRARAFVVVETTVCADSREINAQVCPHRRNVKVFTLQFQHRSQALGLKQVWKHDLGLG